MTSFAALEWERALCRARKGADYAVCVEELRGYPSIERQVPLWYMPDGSLNEGALTGIDPRRLQRD